MRKRGLEDIALAPLIFLLSNDKVDQMGLMSLRTERMDICLEHCSGRVLDIGAGEGNILITKWRARGGDGIGVDVFPWPGVDKVCDTRNLPFENESFDTVSFVACFGHIPERERVLLEANRVLKPGGKVLITELNPIVGFLRHKSIWWWDKDQSDRGMKEGEVNGLWDGEVKKLLAKSGFRFLRKIRFAFGINQFYIGEKSFAIQT